MEKIPFGNTGHLSTRILFGSAAFWEVSQYEADKTMDLILEKGINHIDTAHSYGQAEERLGPWLKHHRNDFFLATKTEQRSKKDALEELYRSLDLLKTDHIDLWQMHFLIQEDQWNTAFGEGGALEAFTEAKEQGLVRFLGVTGHELIVPEMHLRSLERYDFDSVLLPYNYILMQNPRYREKFMELYKLCREKNIAFQCIKTNCRGPWGNQKPNRTTWYQPFEEPEDIHTAIQWALMLENSFINSAGDISLVPYILEAGEQFDPARDYSDAMKTLAKEKNMQPLFV